MWQLLVLVIDHYPFVSCGIVFDVMCKEYKEQIFQCICGGHFSVTSIKLMRKVVAYREPLELSQYYDMDSSEEPVFSSHIFSNITNRVLVRYMWQLHVTISL